MIGTKGTMGHVKVAGGGSMGSVHKTTIQAIATMQKGATTNECQSRENPAEATTQLRVKNKVSQCGFDPFWSTISAISVIS